MSSIFMSNHKTQMKPVQFNMQKSKEFYEDLKKQVKAYFADQQKSDKGNWVLYTKTIILLTTWIALYLCILFVAKSTLAVVWFYVAFGLVGALIGFNVMHDWGHGSYSKNKKLNTVMWYAMNLLWSDINFWKISHNVLHHTFTNIEWYDDDIENRPIFRFHPDQKIRRFHKYQHIYGPIAYGLWLWNWIFYSDFRKFFKWNWGQHQIARLTLRDKILFWITKIGLIAIYYIIPATQVGWWAALLGLVLMYYFMSLFVTTIFQLAHVLENTSMVSHKDYKVEEHRAVHQLETTANFSMRSKFWTWLLGGLNFQVEHHLFPQISHVHYPQLAKIVQRVCHQYDIPYHAYATIGDAFVSHLKYIKKMGRYNN